MDKFLTLTISGAVAGAIYSLVAAGLTLSYSATGIFNFAYGSIAFATALLYYELHTGLGWPIVPAAAFCLLVFCPLLGMFLDVAVLRPLTRATESAKVMATVGLLIAIPALAHWIVDTGISTFHWKIPDAKLVYVPPGLGPSPKKQWFIHHVVFDSNQLIVLITAAVIPVALWFLLRRTSLGLEMRAVVDRPTLAELRGVNNRRTSRWAWIIGTVLAGIAGIIGAPIFSSLNENTYTTVMFVAAAAAALGRLRSVPLAFVGGLLLGIAENLVRGYATFASKITGFGASVPFVLLLVGLALTTRERGRRGVLSNEGPPPADYTSDLTRWRIAAPWVVSVIVLLLYVYVLADDFWLGITIRGLALAIVFMSFTILTGIGGMVSLSQAAFVTSSGLTAGLLMSKWSFPFVPALLGGIAAAVVLGVIVAIPAIHLGGLPLALATLALAFLGDLVLFQWDWFNNFGNGWKVPPPAVGPFHLTDQRTMATVLMLAIAALVVMVRNLNRSAFGRSLLAVRGSDVAATASGLSIARTKLAAFALSAAVAGFGGVFLAAYTRNASHLAQPTQTGLLWLATVVLWGIRRPAGAIVAGLAAALGPNIINNGLHVGSFGWDGTKSVYIPAILFGLGAVQLAREPDGVLAITAGQNQARRLKRSGRRLAHDAVDGGPADVLDSKVGEVVRAGSSPDSDRIGGISSATNGNVDLLLALRNLRAGYGAVEVLHGIDLTLRPGTITAVLGPNGAGKSTLCLTAAGIVPARSGRLEFLGEDITAVEAYQRARRGIVLAPESRGIFPGLTVSENLLLWLGNKKACEATFERFPILDERRGILARNLSGGEQQILTLAPLLARPPAVLIADEPSLGLAPLIVDEIMGLFAGLRDQGTTLLLTEEKPRLVLPIADDVAFLELGLITWHGARAAVDDVALGRLHLGTAGASS